jgi:hypothetical protein
MQRDKAISNAVAELARNALVPAAVREGFAALAEEVRDLGGRLGALELAVFEKERSDG